MSEEDSRYKVLEDAIQLLLMKHKDISATMIIQLADSETYMVCGNLCPICSVEMLLQYIVDQKINHFHVDKTNEIKDKKKVH